MEGGEVTRTVYTDRDGTAAIDLHGLHPKNDDIEGVIADGIRQAAESGQAKLRIIHGHGFSRPGAFKRFVNSNTGYLGRIGIYEFLVPDDSMREILETNAVVSVIREIAKKGGYRNLREEGIVKVMQGLTTVEEVIRVTS